MMKDGNRSLREIASLSLAMTISLLCLSGCETLKMSASLEARGYFGKEDTAVAATLKPNGDKTIETKGSSAVNAAEKFIEGGGGK